MLLATTTCVDSGRSSSSGRALQQFQWLRPAEHWSAVLDVKVCELELLFFGMLHSAIPLHNRVFQYASPSRIVWSNLPSQSRLLHSICFFATSLIRRTDFMPCKSQMFPISFFISIYIDVCIHYSIECLSLSIIIIIIMMMMMMMMMWNITSSGSLLSICRMICCWISHSKQSLLVFRILHSVGIGTWRVPLMKFK